MLKNYKQIPNFPLYFISEDGKSILKSCKEDLFMSERGKVYKNRQGTWVIEENQDLYVLDGGLVYRKIKQTVNNRGYAHVSLIYKRGDKRNLYVHNLVYRTFVGVIPSGKELNHKDHNKLNNSKSNLEVLTHQENLIKQVEFYGNKVRPRCKRCGKKFYIEDSVFCTKCLPLKSNGKRERTDKEKASHTRKRKVVRPDKEKLFELISNNTFKKVGDLYNVSENTIRKWCKYYGLPFRRRDIEQHNRE